MGDQKTLIRLICISIALVSAVVAFIVFKAQIFGFLGELKERIDDKRCLRRGEYTDFADM
ncbi:MAG: hypothetical protein FWC90_07885 [Oscillospiraceae bacterium]|nr:hypothetical protein [Oscillospiraceae bacterium]